MLIIDGLEALGTRWWVKLTSPAVILTPEISNLATNITSLIFDFQNKYSRFDSTSLVSQLNNQRILDKAPKDLISMLRIGVNFYNQTQGLFNIGLESQLVAIGYGKSSNPTSNHRVVADISTLIQIDRDTVKLAGDGNIDLGGLGKGYLIELIARFLECNNHTNYLINGGGDIQVGGIYPQSITLENPFNSSLSYGQIVLGNNINQRALACSSSVKRSWMDGAGQLQSHIINPQNVGNTSTHTASFVIGPSILTADIVATTACIITNNQTSYNQEILDRLQTEYGLVVKMITEKSSI